MPMDKLTQEDGSSMDMVKDNIEKLKEIFPDVFSEGRVDFDILKETLGEYLETQEERYNFNWRGNAQARRIAQTPFTGTLRPTEKAKIDCGKAHFKAIGEDVSFTVANKFDEFIGEVL
ncbi:MAG: hypothetical protein Q9M11_07185 [Mariprofundaceae bacterium]|nr:hypothetical protein [Mariprofundaceae bacterium]